MIAISAKDKTFANTIDKLAKYESDARTIGAIIGFYKNVSPIKELREASQKQIDVLG